MYMVRDIIKDTNLLDHSMCNVPNAYRAHQGILGATEKIKNETIVLKPKAVVDCKQAWNGVIEAMERVEAKQRPCTQDPQAEEEEISRERKAYRKHPARSPHSGH